MKEIVILGGPNGAGKTTTARVLLPALFGSYEFVNADELARGLDVVNPDAAALTAGRLMLARIHALIQLEQSFAFETTLAGKGYAKFLAASKARGWRIVLMYLWLPSPEAAIERVARRVREGGHSIPSNVIRRRFYAGIENLMNLYLPLADDARIYDNSENRVLIAEKSANAPLNICNVERWDQLRGAGQ